MSRVMVSSEGSRSQEDGFRNGDDESGEDMSDKKQSKSMESYSQDEEEGEQIQLDRELDGPGVELLAEATNYEINLG